jgi:broad specificity phosphatase PhoE
MTTRLILVRHGQTEWNRVGRTRGRIDIALNETGLAQAEAVAERLAALPLAAIYSSPLKRAVETAAPTARKTGLTVQPLEGLLDINYGRWEGRSPAEVAEAYPDLFHQWHHSPHLVTFPDGESLDEVRSRALAAVKEIALSHEGRTVLIVAHQVVNKVLVCAMLGLDNSRFWHVQQDNGCINVFDYQDGDFKAILVNDTCHLATS